MAKKQEPGQLVKVIQLVREHGGYGYVEYEISLDLLKAHGKVLDKSEPDIYAIFVNQVTKKTRDIFGI